MYALFGRVVWSIHPSNAVVGTVFRVGMQTYATKQEARAAKHRAIANQCGEPMRPFTVRYFAAKCN